MGNRNLILHTIEDMACYGKSFKVFAIKDKDDSRVFIDYVHADQPIHEDYYYTSDKEFEGILNFYREGIKKLEGNDFECMTLLELLKRIE